MPVNPGFATPTTVNGTLLICTVLPIAASGVPNMSRDAPSASTNDGTPPGTASSSGNSVRPAAIRAPSNSKYPGCTAVPLRRFGSTPSAARSPVVRC